MKKWVAWPAAILTLGLLAHGCVATASSSPRRPQENPRADTQHLGPNQGARLERVRVPLIRAMNHPRPLNAIRIGIVADPDTNAANAGDGEFYLTTGLLERADDDRLRGVLAHEITHDDLGHAAKAEILGTGLNLGVVLLE